MAERLAQKWQGPPSILPRASCYLLLKGLVSRACITELRKGKLTDSDSELLGHTNLKEDLTHKTIIENPMCTCELTHETPLHALFTANIMALRQTL